VAYVITLAYASANDQWARFACPLINSLKTKPCQFSSVQFSYVALCAPYSADQPAKLSSNAVTKSRQKSQDQEISTCDKDAHARAVK